MVTPEERSPNPLLSLAGAVVTDVSEHFGVSCLPVLLFLAPPLVCGAPKKRGAFGKLPIDLKLKKAQKQEIACLGKAGASGSSMSKYGRYLADCTRPMTQAVKGNLLKDDMHAQLHQYAQKRALQRHTSAAALPLLRAPEKCWLVGSVPTVRRHLLKKGSYFVTALASPKTKAT